MIKNFPHLAAAHLAAMDGAHEVALVALEDGSAGEEAVGVVHVVDEPSLPSNAEFDMMVRTDRKGHGVGFQLLSE